LAKRFNTQTASLVAANHDEMPEAGRFVAVPVAYAGDRAPVKTSSARRRPVTHTAAARHVTSSKTAAATHRKTTSVAHKAKPRRQQSSSPASE